MEKPKTTAFDGLWTVTIDCPDYAEGNDRARAYNHSFSAVVKDGALQGSYGGEGQPGYHLLTGTIPPNGKATLKLDGIVSSERHAINDAPRGKPYTYRVRVTFEATKGTGVRVGKRKCGFDFVRQ